MTDESTAARAFNVGAPVDSVEAHPAGHINDAFLISAGGRRFLLQRLNPHVFPDPGAVMANIVTLTGHFRDKAEPTLTLVPTTNGSLFWLDGQGAVWRMYAYVDGVRPGEVHSPEDAALVGLAFGRFHRLVADLDPSRLRVSLPGFHDPERRLAVLEKTIADDPHGRAMAAAEDIDAVIAVRRMAKTYGLVNELPQRAVHNDAKAANLLVDDSGRHPPLVIDLDTVMPDSILWDVGDMVRSSTGTPDEDTREVSFDIGRYQALIDSWLGETADLLTFGEREATRVAGPLVTFEQAVRFLTDHLQGDVYFRISRPGENLDRARNQLSLLRSMIRTLPA